MVGVGGGGMEEERRVEEWWKKKEGWRSGGRVTEIGRVVEEILRNVAG